MTSPTPSPMSGIEEAFIQEVEAATSGIVTTEPELREARAELARRVDVRRQRDRRVAVAAVAASAAVLLGVGAWQVFQDDPEKLSPVGPVTGPSASADPEVDAFLSGGAPSPQLLQGLWRLDNPAESRMLFIFTADGHVTYDDTGQLTGNPLVSGTYDVEDDVITVRVDGGRSGCEGRTMTWRAAMPDQGDLANIVPVDADPTSCDRPLRTLWALERLLPPDTYAGIIVREGRDWDSLSSKEALLGTWLSGEARYAIELRQDDTYSMLAGAGEVVDRGTWVIANSGSTLVLTSSADSPSCQAGDQLIVSELRARDTGALNVQGDLQRNDCDLVPWLGWVQMAAP